jgi:hypothetical protein
MYTLAYLFLFFLAALVLAIFNLSGVIDRGWLWLVLAFDGVTFLAGGLILVLLWLRDSFCGYKPGENEKNQDGAVPAEPSHWRERTGG